jgi:hypothetical protein
MSRLRRNLMEVMGQIATNGRALLACWHNERGIRMDEQVLQRLAYEFAGHDDIQALLAAVRNAAADQRLLERFEHDLLEASDALDALQIPQSRSNESSWNYLTLAERIGVLHQRMLYHLRQAQAAADVPQPIQAVMELVMDTTRSASAELAEVHAVLDAYGAPEYIGFVQQADGSAERVLASAAHRLRRLHRLMVEDGLPDFRPPGTVSDPPDV